MNEAQRENYRTACEMLENTQLFVANTTYDINNNDIVAMFDIDNVLEIYTDCIKYGEDVEEAYSMLESKVQQQPFVNKMMETI